MDNNNDPDIDPDYDPYPTEPYAEKMAAICLLGFFILLLMFAFYQIGRWIASLIY